MSKYIDPFSDTGFKAIFGREGQSEVILRDLLNEIFRGQPQFDEIETVQFINTERTREDESNKTIIHDVLCTTETGQRFIVEMQKGAQDRFLMRAIYYVARGITDQAVRLPGDRAWEYDLLPVAGVFITTFPVKGLPDRLLLHMGLADLDTGELIARHVRFAFIQTNNLNKQEDECADKFEKIIFTLKNMARLTVIPFQESEDDIFARMDEVARYASLSPDEKRMYDYELRQQRDRAAELSTARNQGREEGVISVAVNMKKGGMDVKAISAFTGLSEEEIAGL